MLSSVNANVTPESFFSPSPFFRRSIPYVNTLVFLCSVFLSISPVFLYVTKTSFVFPLRPRTALSFNVAVYVIVKFCVVFCPNVSQ